MSVRVPVWVPGFKEVMAASAAEEALLAACRTDGWAWVGDDRPEDTSDPERAVRAGLIRFLLLGGDKKHRPHPSGVWLQGAWIDEELDFRGCETQLDLGLFRCLLPKKLVLRDATIGGLHLQGSRAVECLDLQRIVVTRGVDLTKGFHALEGVNLDEAKIGGRLTCDNGRFEKPKGVATRACRLEAMALNATGAKIGAGVLMRDGFCATGEVSLKRAVIEGHLRVEKAILGGMLSLQSVSVSGGFHWQEVEGSVSCMDLTEAKVGALHDDLDSWARVTGGLRLEGFRYAALHGDLSPQDRLAWLDRCRKPLLPGPAARLGPVMPFLPAAGARAFSPQPYSQLARVLISQGRRGAAATVLFERERRLRETEWLRYQAKLDGSWGAAFRSLVGEGPRFAGLCFQWLFGFGHRPWRALISVAIYWSLATLFFWFVYAAGEFAPNSDVVLTSADWRRAVELGCPLAGEPEFATAKAAGCVMPQDIWTGGLPEAVPPVPASTAAGDYETFSAGLYAADLFLPLDTIGQTEAWAPSKDRGAWGAAGYWARFPIQLFGWIMVAMAAAVLTGVIGKKEE